MQEKQEKVQEQRDAGRSEADQNAEIEALGPEARCVEALAGRGADKAVDEAGVRLNLPGIDDVVKLVSGTNHVVPEEQAVAGEDSRGAKELKADVDVEFRNDAEDVARETAAIAGNGQDAAGDGDITARTA